MMALIWHYTMLFYSEYMCTRRPARHFTKRSTAFSTFPLQLLHVYGGWRMCSMCCIVVERLNKFTTHTHCSCRKSEIVAPFFLIYQENLRYPSERSSVLEYVVCAKSNVYNFSNSQNSSIRCIHRYH